MLTGRFSQWNLLEIIPSLSCHGLLKFWNLKIPMGSCCLLGILKSKNISLAILELRQTGELERVPQVRLQTRLVGHSSKRTHTHIHLPCTWRSRRETSELHTWAFYTPNGGVQLQNPAEKKKNEGQACQALKLFAELDFRRACRTARLTTRAWRTTRLTMRACRPAKIAFPGLQEVPKSKSGSPGWPSLWGAFSLDKGTASTQAGRTTRHSAGVCSAIKKTRRPGAGLDLISRMDSPGGPTGCCWNYTKCLDLTPLRKGIASVSQFTYWNSDSRRSLSSATPDLPFLSFIAL